MTNSASNNGSTGQATQMRLLPDEIEERFGRLQAIPYHPAIARHLGSGDAALLLRQMWYLWRRNKYKPFQKFLEPCDHPLHTTYGSWTTDLDWGKFRFNKARRLLVKGGYISSELHFNSLYWSVNEENLLNF